MRLTPAQQEKIKRERGICVNEACDKCGRLLGSVRWTRKDQPGEWCSRECRDGQAQAANAQARISRRSAGRPAKYTSDRAREKARREQNAVNQRASRTGVSQCQQ